VVVNASFLEIATLLLVSALAGALFVRLRQPVLMAYGGLDERARVVLAALEEQRRALHVLGVLGLRRGARAGRAAAGSDRRCGDPERPARGALVGVPLTRLRGVGRL